MGRDNKLYTSEGKKILHPADAVRRQAKKRKLEKMKKERHEHFEKKMFGMSPEEVEQEIRALKFDQERKKAHKIEVSKVQQDRLTRLESGYKRLKETIQEKHEKRMAEPKSSLHVNFEELKVHRKSSIFYDAVKNPYGAPPVGQTLMYRHPDGSVQREPPSLVEEAAAVISAPGHEPSVTTQSIRSKAAKGVAAGSSESSEAEDEDEEDDDDDAEPMLPADLPGSSSSAFLNSIPLLPHSESTLPPGLPPLPPGPPPPGFELPPAPSPGMSVPAWPTPGLGIPQPPSTLSGIQMPPGLPPGFGMPPLPPGPPPEQGMPPFIPLPGPGMPPLPPGPPPVPGMPLPLGPPPGSGCGSMGQPPLPFAACSPCIGPPPGSESKASSVAPFHCRPPCDPPLPASVPRGPPGPPAKATVRPRSSTGGSADPQPLGSPKVPPSTSAQSSAVAPDLSKAPPPPKRPVSFAGTASSAPASGPSNISRATAFVPTSLRTKKPSQVAGGVIQVSSSSLSYEKRKNLLFTEKPAVAEKLSMDDAFETFMKEIG